MIGRDKMLKFPCHAPMYANAMLSAYSTLSTMMCSPMSARKFVQAIYISCFVVASLHTTESISGLHLGNISPLNQEPKTKRNFTDNDRSVTDWYKFILQIRENNDSEFSHHQ